MNTKLLFKITIMLTLINQLSIFNSFAQEVPFTSPLNNASTITVKGDMKIIANAITGLSGDQSGTGSSFFSGDTTNYNPNDAYNGGAFNDQLTLDYIDIDNDDSTFSSSSADFISGADCPKIAYAGLYWSATYYVDRVDAANGNNSPQLDNLPLVDSRPDFRTIKFKLPGTSTYMNVTAEAGDEGTIYDGYRNTPTNPNDSASNDIPYVCYADVTEALKSLENPDGTYTVANVRSAIGLTEAGNGISSGWTMVIIYEDPSSTKKQFATQHGFLDIGCETGFELAINTGQFAGQGISHTENNFDPGNVPLPNYPLGLTGDLVLVDDDNGTVDDGCQTLINQAVVDGKIAVLRRGACSFTQKVINAQDAGAIAVIVVNNDGGNGTIAMTGVNANISIPSVMIGNQNGDSLIEEISREEALGRFVNITLSSNVPSGCDNNSERLTFTGFQTPPAPSPVNARFGVASLEGDFGLEGDELAINAAPLGGIAIPLSANPVNSVSNFFNSSISVDGNYNIARNPASENTLGFDVDIFDVANTDNSIIGNNQSSIEFIVSTQGDNYRIFLNTFSIEIVEPELTGYKRVLDIDGVDISGGDLQFGQEFFYEYTLQNTGNENLTNASLTSKIADNIDFVQGTITAPPGVNAVYDDVNRKVIFTFDNSVVERFDAEITVRLGVKVVDSCRDLRDACSDEIPNTALVSYTGQNSGITVADTLLSEPVSCSFILLPASNFLDTSGDCNEEISAFICSGTIDLVAESGFPQYIWTDVSTNRVIGTLQTLTVSSGGVYRVEKTGNPNCLDRAETWTVTSFNTIQNPIVDIINDVSVNGSVRTCPITGEALPEIFLCGSGGEQYLDPGLTTATSIIWERLDPAACPSVIRDLDCPTIDTTCDPDWIQVATTTDYTVTEAGEYRIRAEFDGGCIETFYFNVFKNNFELSLVVVRDIICGTPGILRVQNSSTEYDYQLITPSNITSPYQTSPEFTGLVEEGQYILFARENSGLPTACVFQADVFLENLVSVVSMDVVNPTCIADGSDDFGLIQIQVTEGQPNYTYNISSTTTTFIATEGPTTSPDHIFTNLDPDTYNVEVISFDGYCVDSQQVTILPGGRIEADVTSVDALCNGDQTSIEVTVTAGIAPFTYTLDGAITIGPTDQNSITFNNVMAGNYSVNISDSNNCAGIFEITINEPIPISGFISTTPVICSGGILSTGSVVVENVTGGTANTTGYNYTLYNSDDTLVTSASPIITPVDNATFSDIDFGDYYVTIEDENGCVFRTGTVTISSPPDDLQIVFDANASNCNTDGVVYDIAIASGIPPYEIRIVGEAGSLGTFVPTNGLGTSPGLPFVEISGVGGNLHKTTGLSFGIPYTFEVRDGGGCIYRETTSSQSNGLSSSVSRDVTAINEGAISCDNPETVMVSVNRTIGNTNGFQFDLLPIGGEDIQVIPEDPSGTTTATFNLPSVGNYSFRITDLDTGCLIDTTPYEVLPFDTIAVSATLATDILCFGDNSGEINIEVTGYTGAYNYTVTNTSTATVVTTGTEDAINPLLISGLSVGTFEVFIESLESPFCDQVSTPIVILQPDPIVLNLVDTTAPNCNNPVSTVTMEATGGVGSYIFAYVPGQFPQAEPAAFTEPSTFDLDPSISLDWVVFVRDVNGCISSSQITIPFSTINPVLNPLPQFVDDPCIFDNNYTFTVTAKSNVVAPPGTGTLTFQLNGNTPVPGNISNTEHQFTVTSPGTYTVTVFDENGCPSNQETITVFEELVVDAEFTVEPTCLDTNGVIMATVSGGSNFAVNPSNFTFELTGTDSGGNQIGTIIQSGASGNVFTAISSGIYMITVTDAEIGQVPGCSASIEIVRDIGIPITADINITQDYSCNVSGGNNPAQLGEITISNPAGGNGNYEYSIDGVDFSNTIGVFKELTDGTYTLFIRDIETAACPVNLGSLTIDSLQEIIDLDFIATQVQCPGLTTDITVIATGTNGANSFEYRIVSPVSIPWQASNIFLALDEGSIYTFEARTSIDGCMYSEDFAVNPIDQISVNATVVDEPTCNGDTNGSLLLNVSNVDLASTTYSYQITGGTLGVPITGTSETISSLTINALGAGNYFVEVMDETTNCIATDTVTINEPPAITFDVTTTPIAIDADGMIEVNNSSGGTGVYEYELRTSSDVLIPYQGSNTFIITASDTYIIAVRDTNNCEVTQQVVILPAENQNPIIEYADEILFCAITGQSYPVITIQDENGEVIEVPFTNVLSIVWQQLDDISCNRPLDETCPTTDDSCSSDWFDFETGTSCVITEPGEYRVVITFNTRSEQNVRTYYFRANANVLDVEDFQNPEINLYPNPGNTIVTINTEVRSIRVFDISGKVVIETSQRSFDISTLESGVYFTEVETTTGSKAIIKLMKE